MSRRVAVILLVTGALGGCSHGYDAGNHAILSGSAIGFGTISVTREGPSEAQNTPTPVTWETDTHGPIVHEVRGPRAVAEEDGPYLLDTGDRLRIFVYGQPSLSRVYPVDHDGKISVPLIGHVMARGLTTGRLEGAIKARLGAQYVKDPHVTVDIAQNRPFFILGEVRQAGQYPYVSGMTVQAAIAIAGGFSERANERKIQITRRTDGVIEKMDVPQDYVVLPGDTLFIYERWF
jgi:polysaccharide biosynthesis/export protein